MELDKQGSIISQDSHSLQAIIVYIYISLYRGDRPWKTINAEVKTNCQIKIIEMGHYIKSRSTCIT